MAIIRLTLTLLFTTCCRASYIKQINGQISDVQHPFKVKN